MILLDGLSDVIRSVVGHIVPVHRGEHHVVQPPPAHTRHTPARARAGLHSLGHGHRGVARLLGVERRRGAGGLDAAEAAAARARVAHQHDGGGGRPLHTCGQ